MTMCEKSLKRRRIYDVSGDSSVDIVNGLRPEWPKYRVSTTGRDNTFMPDQILASFYVGSNN
jgi:hypothetical protein